MKLRYTPEAWHDMESMRDYIANTLYNPIAAERILQCIHAPCLLLKEQPKMGRCIGVIPSSKSEVRFIISEKHMVFYTADEAAISVIRVLNEKQDYLQIILTITDE